MLFNSYQFFIFLILVYSMYRLIPHRQQNLLLLTASYYFYGCWDIRFLFLIILSTVVDYTCGLLMARGVVQRKERLKASSWAILSAFFFVVVQWGGLELPETYNLTLFRGLFSWRIGWLIFFGICFAITIANFFYPKIVQLEERRRRQISLLISITTNLSILGFFKYFNFFIENMEVLLTTLSFNPESFRLNIILPVGISFYTFQTMSYTIDIYREKLEPTDHYLDFALYVAYFPQLVAGPIERAVNLLPKIMAKRTIDMNQTLRGIHLIVYGLFKKVVIADGVARTVNQIYGSTGQVTWLDVVAGTVLFAIQIYCDFSGYSDIARGTSKLFGIDIMLNFKFPYFSKNPQEFWTRWHISLSTWLRDYLYIPMGGNRLGVRKTYRNLTATMLLGGLWHGAAWNFIFWGLFHGVILSIHRMISYAGKKGQNDESTFFSCLKIIGFFMVTLYGWLIFRSPTVDKILEYSSVLIFDFGNLHLTAALPRAAAIFGMPIFIFIEIYEYAKKGRSFYTQLPVYIWTAIYASFVFCIAMGMTNETSQFIYFQF